MALNENIMARDSADTLHCIIVSDIHLYREGLATGLARLGHFKVAESCGSSEVMAYLPQIQPDLVFLDMSRANALDLARLLSNRYPMLPLIGFGVSGNDEALACVEAGIRAFVGANGTVEELDQAALMALDGKLLCSPSMTAQLARRLANLAEGRMVCSTGLTQRESEIANLVDDGLSNKEIARLLQISPATVKNHVHMILEKLNIHRRGAIRRQLAFQSGEQGRTQVQAQARIPA